MVRLLTLQFHNGMLRLSLFITSVGAMPENLVMKGFNETVIIYDTKPNCEAARANFIKDGNRLFKKTGDMENVDTPKSMKCVSTDNPRLEWSGYLRKP